MWLCFESKPAQEFRLLNAPRCNKEGQRRTPRIPSSISRLLFFAAPSATPPAITASWTQSWSHSAPRRELAHGRLCSRRKRCPLLPGGLQPGDIKFPHGACRARREWQNGSVSFWNVLEKDLILARAYAACLRGARKRSGREALKKGLRATAPSRRSARGLFMADLPLEGCWMGSPKFQCSSDVPYVRRGGSPESKTLVQPPSSRVPTTASGSTNSTGFRRSCATSEPRRPRGRRAQRPEVAFRSPDEKQIARRGTMTAALARERSPSSKTDAVVLMASRGSAAASARRQWRMRLPGRALPFPACRDRQDLFRPLSEGRHVDVVAKTRAPQAF